MKVKLRKCQSLMLDEMRVINVGREAIQELLFETLTEHLSEYFDVSKVNDEEVGVMQWDSKNECLTYAVIPISQLRGNKQIDFDYLRKKVGITTASLFHPNRYKKLRISQRCFLEE